MTFAVEPSESQSSAQPQVWLRRLHALQNFLALAYAVSLPLSMTASWVLLTAAIVAVTAELFVNRAAVHKLWRSAPLAVPMLCFAAVVAISGAANGGAGEALRSVISLRALLSYFVATLCFGRYPRLAANCVTAVLCVGAVAGIWGSIQQIFNFHPFGYRYLQGTGFLGGPMPFAGEMQVFSMLAFGLLITGGYRHLPRLISSRPVFLALTAANFLGLVFAGERSAWLGGLAGIAAATMLLSWRSFIKSAVILTLVAIVSYSTVPLVHTRVDSFINGKQDVSTRVRLNVWQRAIAEWQRSPVVGVGFLKFPHLNIPEAIVPGHSRDLNHAHSNYLQILATTGLIGLPVFGWLLLSMLLSARRLYLTGLKAAVPILSGYGNGLFAATISLAVAGLFEYNFGTAQVRLTQWFLLGLLSLLP